MKVDHAVAAADADSVGKDQLALRPADRDAQ
jgi:hypothetical protein